MEMEALIQDQMTFSLNCIEEKNKRMISNSP